MALFAVECELNFPIVFATSYESTCPESSIAGAIAGALTAFGSVTILSISIIILASYYHRVGIYANTNKFLKISKTANL